MATAGWVSPRAICINGSRRPDLRKSKSASSPAKNSRPISKPCSQAGKSSCWSELSIPASPGTFSLVSDTLVINEIYLSLQGESTFAGLPCVFIRLTACDLRCSYCDTAYAFTEGKKRTLEEIQLEVNRLATPFSARNQK